MLYYGESVKAIPVEGRIGLSCYGDSGIYYIRIKEENAAAAAFIGFIDYQLRELRYDMKLPLDVKDNEMKKLMATGGIAYILTNNKMAPGECGVLHRFNINSMEISSIQNIIDFQVQGQDLFLLAKSRESISVALNESAVPVTLMDESMLRIRDIVDGRMVLVTDGNETEIIDIRTARNLYRYSAMCQTLAPDEYNLSIQAVDETASEPEDRNMIFYKIFIDGVETGRTDCGPPELLREFRARLDANKYHLVKLERWILNAAKGRYDRVNNIHQPKLQHIFIPMNRVVRLIIRFRGKDYEYEVIPIYR